MQKIELYTMRLKSSGNLSLLLFIWLYDTLFHFCLFLAMPWLFQNGFLSEILNFPSHFITGAYTSNTLSWTWLHPYVSVTLQLQCSASSYSVILGLVWLKLSRRYWEWLLSMHQGVSLGPCCVRPLWRPAMCQNPDARAHAQHTALNKTTEGQTF